MDSAGRLGLWIKDVLAGANVTFSVQDLVAVTRACELELLYSLQSESFTTALSVIIADTALSFQQQEV